MTKVLSSDSVCASTSPLDGKEAPIVQIPYSVSEQYDEMIVKLDKFVDNGGLAKMREKEFLEEQ